MSIITHPQTKKTCSKCQAVKPLDKFRQKRNQCLDCERAYHRKYNKSANGKMRMHKYGVSKKGRAKHRRNAKTPTGRAAHKRYVKKNGHKRRAKDAVNNAIKAGKHPAIHTQTCTRCGDQAVHWHHWNYDPKYHLDVLPLCKQCHITVHQRPIIPIE